MKKFFVALMAVLLLAACGEKEVVKTPGDVLLLTSKVFESTTAKMEQAENADDVIVVMEELTAEIKSFDEKYADIITELENMDDDEVEEKYSKEVETLNAVFANYSEVMMEKIPLMENLTPEQEERWMNILSAE